MSITQRQAFEVAHAMTYARDDLLAFYHTGSEVRRDMAVETIADAARAIGYTLTPIVTPSPDSGRAKEIGDVEPNPAEIAGLFFDHRN